MAAPGVARARVWTPLIHSPARADWACPISHQDTVAQPTNSFKARGLSAASRARPHLVCKILSIPTAGNAQCMSGLRPPARHHREVFMAGTQYTVHSRMLVDVADVTLVDGLITDSVKMGRGS